MILICSFYRPESLGVICGTVFLICMFLFIPVPFVTRWFGAENVDAKFPHNEVFF